MLVSGMNPEEIYNNGQNSRHSNMVVQHMCTASQPCQGQCGLFLTSRPPEQGGLTLLGARVVQFKPKPGSQFRGDRPVLRKGPAEPPVEQGEGTRKWKQEWREDDKFFGSELKDHFGFQFKWSSNGVQVELVDPQMPFSQVQMWPVRIYHARWQFVPFWMRFRDLGGRF